MIADLMPEGDEVLLDELNRKLRRLIVDRYNPTLIHGIERSPLDL